ncbi:hypothetical protein [Streptomyces flaveolus]|uniref:hypothetical protein n=1 Tax=Streptomyces flaveolus TaxID=67297 RepID=UPI0034169A46
MASHFSVGAASQGARKTFYPYYRAYFAQGRGACLDRSTFEAMAGPDGALLVSSTREIIASRVPGRVSRLLCIDAFVLASGENAVDVLRITRALFDAAAERAQPWRVRRGGVANSEPSRIHELETGDAALMTKPVELNYLLLDNA